MAASPLAWRRQTHKECKLASRLASQGSLRTKPLLFAGGAVAVAVKVALIPRLAGEDRRSTSSSNRGAIGVVDSADPLPRFGTKRSCCHRARHRGGGRRCG